MRVKNYKLIFDFLQKRRIYSFYDGITNTTNGRVFRGSPKKYKENNHLNFIHVVNYIPPFLNPIVSSSNNIGLKSINGSLFYGFMVDLKDYQTINEYLMSKMGSKSRTKIRGYVRKLETCFNITYKFYFGEITRKQYEFLFQRFHTFISKRFLQRGDTHELLSSWEAIEEASYKMILDKTASLFVIFNEEEPIDICLNYHHENILHDGIRSYDVDYSKFRLGYIDIYKQLEWCFANKVRIFDLGVGDMEYKRRWCNVIYNFENQILFDAKSISKTIFSYCLLYFYHFKEYLKKKKLNRLYYKIRRIGSKQVNQKESYQSPLFHISELNSIPDLKNTIQMDLKNPTLSFLKKPIYDFQYQSLDSFKNIHVYKVTEDKNLYYILGKTKIGQLQIL